MIPPLKHELIKFADLVECFRHGNAVLSLNNISVDGVQLNPEWSGSLVIDCDRKAKIRIKASTFKNDLLTLFPGFGPESVKKKDKLNATIDHQFSVSFTPLWRGYSSLTSGASYTTRFTFNECRNSEVGSQESVSSCSIEAYLPECELRTANDSTTITRESKTHGNLGSSGSLDTLTGDVGSYRYRVSAHGADLKISIRTTKGNKSNSSQEDKLFYQAFLEAFRWVNGGSQYVYHFSHHRSSVLIDEWCQIPKPQQVNSRLVSSAPLNTNVTLLIEKFIEFSQLYPDRLEPLKTQLWQYRDAIAGRTITWGNITQLAALNEGLAREILTHHLGLGKNAIKKLTVPFLLDENLSKGSAKAKFYHATQALGISWADFAPAFEYWRKARNPLAHGNYPSIEDWVNSDEFFAVYDSMVNSYNWMALRYIGFPSNKIDFNNKHFPI